jgi:hypothetical protein
MPSMRIVVANGCLIHYPEGGGVWIGFLQYLQGLRALGHDVLWLELYKPSGNTELDEKRIGKFFAIFREYDVADAACVLADAAPTPASLKTPALIGKTTQEVEDFIRTADVMWNLASAVRQPLLSMFKRRAVIDGDPGHWHVSAFDVDMGQNDHHAFLTVGSKINDVDCEVPRFGLKWHPFAPCIYLPNWQVAPDPGPQAPFTSITQWNWGELHWNGRILSTGKRDSYMRYLDLPQRSPRLFELAANIAPHDNTGDREALLDHGWKIVDPHQVAASCKQFQRYIAGSRAELSCPKPVYRELRTGWLSDRSASFLASGRPVLAEDTGAGDHYPTGAGLVTFRTMEEAIQKVAEIDANYDFHSRSAREFAESYLDSQRTLTDMLDACA